MPKEIKVEVGDKLTWLAYNETYEVMRIAPDIDGRGQIQYAFRLLTQKTSIVTSYRLGRLEQMIRSGEITHEPRTSKKLEKVEFSLNPRYCL